MHITSKPWSLVQNVSNIEK